MIIRTEILTNDPSYHDFKTDTEPDMFAILEVYKDKPGLDVAFTRIIGGREWLVYRPKDNTYST